MKTLFINTTPTDNTPKGSVSRQALKTYKYLYAKKNPEHTLIDLDLNEEKDLEVLTSKNFTDFFEGSDKYIDLVKSVDKVVIAVPMINFTYAPLMKAFFDKIAVANKTFRYKYDGTPEGLIENLTVQIIATRGSFKDKYDFSGFTESMEGTWKFLGAKVEPTILLDGVKTPEFLSKSKEEIVKHHIHKIEQVFE